MRSGTSAIERLRLSIDCLPVRTRAAMLEGLDGNDIIVGSYTSRDGGVCPMLAAHRSGGRTNLLSFARAWDRFTRAGRRARRATPRELSILRFELEASLLAEERVDLGAAIAEHRNERARRAATPPAVTVPAGAAQAPRAEPEAGSGDRRPRPGDEDRSAELRWSPGWAWLRPLRRLDDYERALDRLEREIDGVGEIGASGTTPPAEAHELPGPGR